MKYSICLVCRNNFKNIKYCIDSIISQTNKNFEIIVVDNHSTDNTWKLLNNYSKKYKNFFCYSNDKNRSKGYSKDIAFKYSRGHFLIYDIDPEFIFFNSVLKDIVAHYEKISSDKLVSCWYGNKQSNVLIVPRELYILSKGFDQRMNNGEDYKLANSLLSLNRIRFYFNLPFGRSFIPKNIIKNKSLKESKLNPKTLNKYYSKDADESKIKKDILLKEFKISRKNIDMNLIKLIFEEKFDLYYYLLDPSDISSSICTVMNYPNFYKTLPFKSIKESYKGTLLDLIYIEKPNSIKTQINMILVSKKTKSKLLKIGLSKVNRILSSKTDSLETIRPNQYSVIISYSKKENKHTRIYTSIDAYLLTLKRIYLSEIKNNMKWVHASGIAFKNKAHIFIGSSNSGKSTTAFRLCNLIEGCTFLSDDTCAIRFIDEKLHIIGHPLPGSLRKRARIFIKKTKRFSLFPTEKGFMVPKVNKVLKPKRASTLFFLERTRSKNTHILDVGDKLLPKLSKKYNNKPVGGHIINFEDIKLKDRFVNFKLVRLGMNIDALVEYIKSLH